MLEYLIIILLILVVWRMCRGQKYYGYQPKIDNKFAVITGANSGMGKQLALNMASLGCSVIIGARDQIKGQKVVAQIIQKTKNKNVKFFKLDLSDRQSIENFVSKIDFQRIDFLVNNAAVMWIQKLSLNKMKLQMHYAVNYQGHFYLTYLLWSKLNKSDFFRIINLSSITHRYVNVYWKQTMIDFDNLNYEKGGYELMHAYARSKLCINLFTKALAEKINTKKGIVMSVHPGMVRTQITRNSTLAVKICSTFYPIHCYLFKSPKQGCQTQFFLLYSDPSRLQNGCYYAECKKGKENSFVTKQNWQKLWKISNQNWKINFDERIKEYK